MKTIQFFCTALFFTVSIFSTCLSAQQNVLKIKPLSFEFAYERALGDRLSLQLAARVFPIGIGVDDGDDSGASYTNYRLTPEARIYLAKSGNLSGFFIAPHAKFALNSFKAETVSDNDLTATGKFHGTSIGGGLTLGWQWIMGKGFSIDTQFGWGYTKMRFSDATVTYSDGHKEVEQPDVDGLSFILPRVGFSIGYAF